MFIEQETTESVTFRMLDNVVALEMIQTRLTQQIRPYMKEHHLKEDKVFTKYVKVRVSFIIFPVHSVKWIVHLSK